MTLTKKEMKAVLKSQQGELDGAEIYKALSGTVKDKKDAEVFLRLAADEGRHAAVFFKLSGKKLQPKTWKGKGISILYRILGKKALYKLIAGREYAAKKNYAPLAEWFPEVNEIMADEIRHGDAVKGLLKE